VRKRRHFSPFSLSFLDIMACGFGAVVLLFLIVKHQASAVVEVPQVDMSAEVSRLEEEIVEAQKNLVALRNTMSEVDERLVITQGRSSRVLDEVKRVEEATSDQISSAQEQRIEQLKAELKRLEAEKKQLQAQKPKGPDIRTVVGEGSREYLTGLRMGGNRILILLDTSASMLDETIVNIIRRRNMDDAVKRRSRKWRQAVDTVDWLSARFPSTSSYQIYTFNTDVSAALSGTQGRWLDVRDVDQLDKAIDQLRQKVPTGGTSLEKAFMAIGGLNPRPDNIFLITDGLPTQGLGAPRGVTVDGRERLKLFDSAIGKLPRGIPVNVILLPMEGDSMAASEFWRIALNTRGSFMTPTKDWP
jgi:hypothetical protein